MCLVVSKLVSSFMGPVCLHLPWRTMSWWLCHPNKHSPNMPLCLPIHMQLYTRLHVWPPTGPWRCLPAPNWQPDLCHLPKSPSLSLPPSCTQGWPGSRRLYSVAPLKLKLQYGLLTCNFWKWFSLFLSSLWRLRVEVTAAKGFIANTALCSLCDHIAHHSRNRLGQEFGCESRRA